jgi:HSP20 family protein
MDKDTKNFFEKLAGINGEENEEEFGKFIKPETDEGPEEEIKGKEIEEIDDDSEEDSLSEILDEGEGELAIDFYQTPTNFVIESTIAGVDPENIDVNITPESVTIKGKRDKFSSKSKAGEYLVQECFWGRFSRSIILPQEVDPDKSQATIKNGVLKITLPKANKEKAKKIKVKFE